MKIIGQKLLDQFINRHADSKKQLISWLAEMETAYFKNPNELKNRYPSASLVGNYRVIFNIKGSKYRLEVMVAYNSQLVKVQRLGTHAEYSKWKF